MKNFLVYIGAGLIASAIFWSTGFPEIVGGQAAVVTTTVVGAIGAFVVYIIRQAAV